MKKSLYPFILLFLTFCITCSLDKGALDSINEGIHIRKGFAEYDGQIREYKFKNVPAKMDLVPIFPEAVVEDLPGSIKQKVTVEHWLYSSVEDAEIAMVEQLELSNLYKKNIIDFPLPGGQIGDNCWYQFNGGVIQFLRNNVLVSVASSWDSPADFSEIEFVARSIDTALIYADKVTNSKKMPAPVIHSIDIISDLPQTWGQPVTLKIVATDAKYNELWFRKYATGLACITNDGVLTFTLTKSVDSTADPNIVRVKIWIWNDAHVVASADKEIPLK